MLEHALSSPPLVTLPSAPGRVLSPSNVPLLTCSQPLPTSSLIPCGTSRSLFLSLLPQRGIKGCIPLVKCRRQSAKWFWWFGAERWMECLYSLSRSNGQLVLASGTTCNWLCWVRFAGFVIWYLLRVALSEHWLLHLKGQSRACVARHRRAGGAEVPARADIVLPFSDSRGNPPASLCLLLAFYLHLGFWKQSGVLCWISSSVAGCWSSVMQVALLRGDLKLCFIWTK